MGRNEGNEEKHWKGSKEEEEEHKQNREERGKEELRPFTCYRRILLLLQLGE
jgi:hypothetical protein